MTITVKQVDTEAWALLMEKERDAWRKQYLDVADAIMAESKSPADLIARVRDLREKEQDRLNLIQDRPSYFELEERAALAEAHHARVVHERAVANRRLHEAEECNREHRKTISEMQSRIMLAMQSLTDAIGAVTMESQSAHARLEMVAPAIRRAIARLNGGDQ